MIFCPNVLKMSTFCTTFQRLSIQPSLLLQEKNAEKPAVSCYFVIDKLLMSLFTLGKSSFLQCQTFITFFAVLISRWENLLQKLLENVNNSKVFEKLKDESKHLRDVTTSLEESIQSAVTDVDLQTQIRKLQVWFLLHYLFQIATFLSYCCFLVLSRLFDTGPRPCLMDD